LGFAKEAVDARGMNDVPSRAVVKGSLVDSRDRKTYATVRIGTQTWMAENLDYETDSSSCLFPLCDKIEGRRYVWRAALQACPPGWHLPSDEEWTLLLRTVGGAGTAGTLLKGASMNGSDAYGFGVVPGGFRCLDASCNEIVTQAPFWSRTETYPVHALVRIFDTGDSGVSSLPQAKSQGASVRCLEDARLPPAPDPPMDPPEVQLSTPPRKELP
jgi:uncharacterized protein (TIGR02145 family)